jgi:hypothetical protein
MKNGKNVWRRGSKWTVIREKIPSNLCWISGKF